MEILKIVVFPKKTENDKICQKVLVSGDNRGQTVNFLQTEKKIPAIMKASGSFQKKAQKNAKKNVTNS